MSALSADPKTIDVGPGDCVAVCPCCLGRVHIPPLAGLPPTLTHGRDRLSGEPCPRSGDDVGYAMLWDRAGTTSEQRAATVYDFPEAFCVRRKGIGS